MRQSALLPFVCVLVCLAGYTAPKEPGPDFSFTAEGQVSLGGKTFPSMEAYLTSDTFRTLGMRCGTRVQASDGKLMRDSADCSLSSTSPHAAYAPETGTIRIPVVVHVLQAEDGRGAVTADRVQDQINILNEDYRALLGTMGELGNDAWIEFHLADTDPSGAPTTGITYSVNDEWYNDRGDYAAELNWDPDRYLNIYTNTAGGYLGYTWLPQDGVVGQPEDGVVINHIAFGRGEDAHAPYDLGRTATHEVGHYLGLLHPFEGYDCGAELAPGCYQDGDLICDTPPQSEDVYGCPADSFLCGTPDAVQNYMGYADDACMTEFTPEQIGRMRCSLMHYRPDLFEFQPPEPTVPVGQHWSYLLVLLLALMGPALLVRRRMS